MSGQRELTAIRRCGRLDGKIWLPNGIEIGFYESASAKIISIINGSRCVVIGYPVNGENANERFVNGLNALRLTLTTESIGFLLSVEWYVRR